MQPTMSIDDGGCGSHTRGALGCKVLLREYQVLLLIFGFLRLMKFASP